MDNTVEEWPANCSNALWIQILIREDLNKTRASVLRTVFIKFKIIIFYSPTEYKHIQEWYQAAFLRITWKPRTKFNEIFK